MKRLRYLILVTLAILLTTKTVYADTQYYTDVAKDNPYYESITWATDKGLVSGGTDGKFNPNGNLSFSGLSLILLRQYMPEQPNIGTGDNWEYSAIGAAEWYGIYKLHIPDSVRYENKVTWAFVWEALAALSENIDIYPKWVYTGNMENTKFDVSEDLAYYMNSSGLNPNRHNQNDQVTRAEFIDYLYRIETGEFNPPEAKIDLDNFWNGLNLQIDENSTWKLRSLAMNDWMKVPEKYKKALISDNWTLILTFELRDYYPNHPLASGICDSKQKRIVLADAYNTYTNEVLIHEVGHYVDDKSDSILDNQYMYRTEIDKLAELLGSDYCKQNRSEMFAEAFRYVTLNRNNETEYNKMKNMIPLMLDYIEKAYLNSDELFDVDAMNDVTSKHWEYIKSNKN